MGFEIESFPTTMPMKNILASPYSFPKLNNGRSYKFHLRGINKEGKSKWSEVSSPVTPLKIPPQPIELRCVPFDKEITVFWVCEELKTPEYSGWYEVESEPPTFTMVVTRQQARFRRLDNGRKYTFRVTAVNQVGKAMSDVSAACIPDDDIGKELYLRKKKAIACEVKEILLKIRKEQKKAKTAKKLVILKKTQIKQSKREKEANAKAYNKIVAKKQRQQRQKDALKRREEKDRLLKKKKMAEQRARVMTNKRRMSILAKERINNLDGQLGRRNKGKNMNTASAMMMSGGGGSKRKKKIKKKGPALLPQNEIKKANKQRKSASAKRKSKSKNIAESSSLNSSKKKKKSRKSSSRKKMTKVEDVED